MAIRQLFKNKIILNLTREYKSLKYYLLSLLSILSIPFFKKPNNQLIEGILITENKKIKLKQGVMYIEIKQNAVVPTNDYVFKKIFGQVGNENITKDFISTILDKPLESVNLEGNTILEKDLFDEKIGILDIKAKLDNQVLCDIEMQVVNHRNIEKRLLFYWSKLYSSGIKSGKNYDNLNKTICILIANYELSNLKEILKGHTEWKIREKDFKNTVLTDMLEIHIIELPKIQKLMQKGSFFKEDADFLIWTKFLLMPNELGEF